MIAAPNNNDGNAAPAHGTLWCPINYPANSGYAWRYIERLCASVADVLRDDGVRTVVTYPAIPTPPEALAGSSAIPEVLDGASTSLRAVIRQARFVRRERVRTAYLSDVATYSWRYPILRLAGVRRIVVHCHGSGDARRPVGMRRTIKRVRAAMPWLRADAIITVSDFVARREREVALFPSGGIYRVWNAIAPRSPLAADERHAIRCELGVPDDAVLFFCGARAAYEKGVDHLLRAFDRAVAPRRHSAPPLHLIFAGGGVDFDAFVRLRDALSARAAIHLLGPRADVGRLQEASDVVVVPSVYQDALPLAVLEGMAAGRPVIGTTVGGIPEMVRHEWEGLLVAPGDEVALASAIQRLADAPALARACGERAAARVRDAFDPDTMLSSVVQVIVPRVE